MNPANVFGNTLRLILASSLLLVATGFLPGELQQQTTAEDFQKNRQDMGQVKPATEREGRAWEKVNNATDLKKKGNAALDYLEEFPEGVYVNYANEVAAVFFRETNNLPKFYEYAEKALIALPHQAALRTALAVTYAEDQNPDPAIRHGEQALATLSAVETIPESSDSTWLDRREHLEAEAHYAVGTAYLLKTFNSGGNMEWFRSAVQHLESSVEIEPRDERTHFRLGFAYQMKRDKEGALLEFARAVALGGSNFAMSRQYLEQAYQAKHGSLQGMDQLVAEQKAYLENIKSPEQTP